MSQQVEVPGYYVRATQLTYQPGGRHALDLSFLSNVAGVDIDHIKLVCSPEFTVGAGATFLGADAPRLIRRIDIHDVQDSLIHLLGPMVRSVGQYLLGDGVADPEDGEEATDVEDLFVLATIPFGHGRGVRDPRDVRLGVGALAEGKVTIHWADEEIVTDIDAGSGTKVDVLCYVVPRRRKLPESPARIAWQYLDVKSKEDHYPVHDDLFAAWLEAPGGAGDASGDTSLAYGDAPIENITSKTLGLDELEVSVLIEDYRQAFRPANPDANKFVNGDAIPIFFAREGQLLGHLPYVSKLHLDLETDPPDGTKLVFGTVTATDGEFVQRHTGIPAAAVGRARATPSARVATRDGRRVAMSSVRAGKRERLPMRLVPNE